MFVKSFSVYHTDREDLEACYKINELFSSMRAKHNAYVEHEGEHFPVPRNANEMHAAFHDFVMGFQALQRFVEKWYEDENEDEEE